MQPLPNYPWHQAVWQQLQSARQQAHLPHALLFSGQTGCGHEQLVYNFAQSLLCLKPDSHGYACQHCRSCEVFKAQAHPDFLLLEVAEDKQAITVDQVRSLSRFLELSRSYSPNRIAIILGAESMNVNAANSLLKSLEEPATHSYILLFSANAKQLMPTMRSRCQQLRLGLPAKPEALAWLAQQSLIQAADGLLSLAGGRPLAAIEEDSGQRLAQKLLFLNHLKSLIIGNISLIEVSAHWEKYDRQELIDWQLAWIHQEIRQGIGETLHAQNIDLDFNIGQEKAWAIYDRLLELKALATHPLNGRLFIENMLSFWL